MKTKLSYADLLGRLDDLKGLAVPPAAEEKGGAFTNYNRGCRYDAEKDCYIDWYDKGDGCGFCGDAENGDLLLMDADGPGVIWRFWTSLVPDENPDIRIFLDGEETPSVDMPLRCFFFVNGDDYPQVNLPNLISTEKSRGWVYYLPIPFNKHIRITASRFFMHQFTYTVYPEGTALPDFRDRFINENNILRAETDRRLEDRGGYDAHAGWKKISVNAAAGGETPLFCDNADGAVAGIRFYPAFENETSEAELLRKLILEIYWDGHEKPAVRVPLGDFFGAAMGIHRHRTVVNGMHRLECYANWYMPYTSARAVIKNRSGEGCALNFEILFEKPFADPRTLLRFHAKWHPEEFLWVDSTRFKKGDRYPDWPVLLTKGSGRFCGMSLHVYNNWRDPVIPSREWWYGKWHPTLPYETSINWFWGEGREKVFTDGEKFPCVFGTGSEDYVGYAWSAEPPFPRWDAPFAAVPDVPLTGKGHTSHSRYQIADNIPFHDGFEFYVEKYKDDIWRNRIKPEVNDNGENCCLFDTVCYWYLQNDMDDEYPEYPVSRLWDCYRLPDEPMKE